MGPYHHRIKDNPKRWKTLVSAAVRVAPSRSEQTGGMVFSRERDELWAPTSALLAGNGGGLRPTHRKLRSPLGLL